MKSECVTEFGRKINLPDYIEIGSYLYMTPIYIFAAEFINLMHQARYVCPIPMNFGMTNGIWANNLFIKLY